MFPAPPRPLEKRVDSVEDVEVVVGTLSNDAERDVLLRDRRAGVL